jgi:hypothetical protein
MKNKLEIILASGLLLSTAFVSGCEEEDDNTPKTSTITNSVPKSRSSDKYNPLNDNKTTSRSDSTKGDITDTFAITYPSSGGSAPYRTEMRGVGIKKPVASYSAWVTTNRRWEQVGSLDVGSNGTWTYSPIYFGGSASEAGINVSYADGTSESATISNINP